MTTEPAGKTEMWRAELERIARDGKASAFALVLHDFETGLHFAIDDRKQFHAASTIKVAVLFALLRAIDEGRLRADAPLHVRNRFYSAVDRALFRVDPESDGYPQLYRSIGRTAKIIDLAEWMIVSSSNLATNLLLDLVGVEYATKVLRDAEVHGIALRRGVDDELAFERGFNNEVTAEGLFQLFAALRGDVLSKQSRERAIHILLGQCFTSMIPAGLPAHASVAHKTGEISTVCHDAGIIYLPEREPYILAVLTESTAEGERRRETIAKISEAIYKLAIQREVAST